MSDRARLADETEQPPTPGHRRIRLRLWVYLGSLALLFTAFAFSGGDAAVPPYPVLALGAIGLVRSWVYHEQGLGSFLGVLFLGGWVAIAWSLIGGASGAGMTLLAAGHAGVATLGLVAFLVWVARAR